MISNTASNFPEYYITIYCLISIGLGKDPAHEEEMRLHVSKQCILDHFTLSQQYTCKWLAMYWLVQEASSQAQGAHEPWGAHSLELPEYKAFRSRG